MLALEGVSFLLTLDSSNEQSLIMVRADSSGGLPPLRDHGRHYHQDPTPLRVKKALLDASKFKYNFEYINNVVDGSEMLRQQWAQTSQIFEHSTVERKLS